MLLVAIGLILFIVLSSSGEFKNKLFSSLFPDKPASHAAPLLPTAPEASFELELEKTAVSPFPDEATPQSLTIGTNFRVDIYARSDIEAANLFKAKINYTSDTVEAVDLNIRDGQSFIKNWVGTGLYTDKLGTEVFSIAGGVSNPGIKTDSKTGAYLMGSIIFKAKKNGTAKIEISDSSAIYSNANNTNILTVRKGTIEVPITDIQLSPSPTLNPISCTGITVTGAIERKTPNGETTYIVESEGKITLAAQTTPIGTKMDWLWGTRSRNLTDSGSFSFNTPFAPTVNYTTPKNANSSVLENITISADIANLHDISKPLASCPIVTLAVKPAVQPTPSPTLTPMPSPTNNPTIGNGDGHNDGKVNFIDLSILLTDFNKHQGFRPGIDLNGDGVINSFDFSLMRDLLARSGAING